MEDKVGWRKREEDGGKGRMEDKGGWRKREDVHSPSEHSSTGAFSTREELSSSFISLHTETALFFRELPVHTSEITSNPPEPWAVTPTPQGIPQTEIPDPGRSWAGPELGILEDSASLILLPFLYCLFKHAFAPIYPLQP